MKKLTALLIISGWAASGFPQVGFNNPNPDPKSILDLRGNVPQKGVLLPYANDTARTIMLNGTPPGNGMMVFDPVESRFYYYHLDSNKWVGFVTESGRVRDKTGDVMPVGSIIAFGGTTPPDGWLLCDGMPISRSIYNDLFLVIGTAWGAGNGTTTFNLPDLRGQFLRGIDNGAGTDPDAATRTDKTGNVVGDVVGSYQADKVGPHQHTVSLPYVTTDSGNRAAMMVSSNAGPDGDQLHPTSTGDGGPETRPKNAYVNYIIKY